MNRHGQRGFLVVAAVALILIVGVMVAGLGYMVASQGGSGGVSLANLAERTAFAGIQRGVKKLREGTAATFATACTNVAETGVAVGTSSFTLTSTTYSASTTLPAGGIAAGATSITLTSSAGFAPHGTAFIDSERINYSSITGNVLNGVTRGVAGTLDKAHLVNAPVSQNLCLITSKGTSGASTRQIETTVLNGQWSESIDGASTAVTNAATTLATVNATMPAGDNLIIAVVSFNNTGANTTFTGAAGLAGLIQLRYNGAAVRTNRYNLIVGGAAGSATLRPEKTYFFVFKHSGAAANPSYSITAQGSVAASGDAEAKMLVINGPAGATNFSYYGQTPGASTVTLNTTGTALTAPLVAAGAGSQDVILAIAAVQVRNNAAAARSIGANTGLAIRRLSPTTALGSNEFTITFGNATNPAGDYGMLLLALDTAPPGASPSYDVGASTVATAGSLQADASLLLLRGVGSVFTNGASVAVAVSPGTQLVSQATTAGVANSAFKGLISGAANLIISGIQYFRTAGAGVSGAATAQEEILYGSSPVSVNPFPITLCPFATSANCAHFWSAEMLRQTGAGPIPSFSVETSASAATVRAEAQIGVIQLNPIGDLREAYP